MSASAVEPHPAGPPVPTRPASSFAGILFILGALFCLTPWGSPPLALAIGSVLAIAVENPFSRQGQKLAKPLLQFCVVLLGFGMDLGVVLRAGRNGLMFAVGTIATTLVLGFLLGKALSIAPKTSALISAGTAICGGSAIAAVGSVIGAGQGEMTVAIGTVFILNAVGLYLFPFLGHLLQLSQIQFGTWAGVAIHDISSVVGASARYGAVALETATAVKLSRALWIVPMALGAALAFRTRPGTSFSDDPDLGKSQGAAASSSQIPWFIGLFLLASLSRSFLPLVASAAPTLSAIARTGFTLTLFLIGAGLSRKTLQAVGWRPLFQGVVLWVFISAASLFVILHTI